MYILDDETDKKLTNITILLNKNEILELIASAEQLLENPPPSDHYHFSSEDYQKEITLCICEPEYIANYHPRIKKLIHDDE